MAIKERTAPAATALCTACAGEMVIKLVQADPAKSAAELRTYQCAGCGQIRTYSVDT